MLLAPAVQESSAVYWSDEVGRSTVYGKITVTLKSSTEADGFVTRKFEVIEEGKVSANDTLLYIYGFNMHLYAVMYCVALFLFWLVPPCLRLPLL